MGVVRSLGVAAAFATLLITVGAPAQVLAPRTTSPTPIRPPAPASDASAPPAPVCPSSSVLAVDSKAPTDECIAAASPCPGTMIGSLCAAGGSLSSICADGFFTRAKSGGGWECVAVKGPTCPTTLELTAVAGADKCAPPVIKPPAKIDATTTLAKHLLPPPPPPACTTGNVVVDMSGEKDDCGAVTNALCTQYVGQGCVAKTCPDGFLFVNPDGIYGGPVPPNTYCRAALRCIDGAYVKMGKGPDVCVRR